MTIRTVWSEGALDHVPERFRPLAKVAYPVSYGLFGTIFGLYGAFQGGPPSVVAVAPHWYPHVICALVGASAVICFVGLVFLKQRVELVGETCLVAFSMMYLILLFVALGTGNGAPVAATTTTAVVIVLLGMRGYDLLSEITARKTAGGDQLQ